MAKSGKPVKKKVRRFYDYSLLFAIAFITVFGLIFIYSSSAYEAQLAGLSSTYYLTRQGAIAGAGFIAMIIISKVDYHIWLKFTNLAYIMSYILMALTMWTPLGKEVNGKKRWFELGPISFQTTELVKIALILMLAVSITKLGKNMNRFSGLFRVFLITTPIALMVTENNLSSGIIIFGIAFVMAYIASEVRWPFYGSVALGVLGLAFAPQLVILCRRCPLLNRISCDVCMCG